MSTACEVLLLRLPCGFVFAASEQGFVKEKFSASL